jgi:hypothetical protein
MDKKRAEREIFHGYFDTTHFDIAQCRQYKLARIKMDQRRKRSVTTDIRRSCNINGQ